MEARLKNVPKLVCGVLCLLNGLIGLSNTFDTENSLRNTFGVQGELSIVAIHCTAVIGSMCIVISLMFAWAITSTPEARKAVIAIFCGVQTVLTPYILITKPYNDPAPAFPLEMPWPIVLLYIALGAAGILVGEPKSQE